MEINIIDDIKALKSENYNFLFNKKTGFFARWGKTSKEDPDMSPFGPEIADIEISTICNGITGTPCRFCYKANTGAGDNMSFETFKTIFHKFPETLTQIAFGIGDINANPDLWKIMEYTRENGIIPNITINGYGIDEEIAEKFVNICGSIAVSKYTPKDVCYNAVKMMTDAGGKQINIHQLVSKETLDGCHELIADIETDERLTNLNAPLFLMLKKKGRGGSVNYVTSEEYKELIDKLSASGKPFGMDSCSANSFLKCIDNPMMEQMVEPCESGLFSIYVDTFGRIHPCSFAENVSFGKGIDLTKITDFDKEVWNSDLMKDWRKGLLACKRSCPIYTEIQEI